MTPEDLEHTLDSHDNDLTRQAKDITAINAAVADLRAGLVDVARLSVLIPELYGHGGANLHDDKQKIFTELRAVIARLSSRFPAAPPQ